MNYLKILVLLNLILFIYSCGAAREGFTNQKKENKDEFLVEKKSPLIMPPDYGKLPLPEKSDITNISDQNKIKELITTNSNESLKSEDASKNFEEFLLKKIKKD